MSRALVSFYSMSLSGFLLMSFMSADAHLHVALSVILFGLCSWSFVDAMRALK